jgi:hypothetical protein
VNCPHCGTDKTDVLETRVYQDVLNRRRRRCFNECKPFYTYEVFAGNLDRRTITATRRGIRASIRARSRQMLVLQSPELTASQLSRQLGITEARVRQIRAEAKT